MLITNEFDDYEIISMSDGEKLERWGKFYLLRPRKMYSYLRQIDADYANQPVEYGKKV